MMKIQMFHRAGVTAENQEQYQITTSTGTTVDEKQAQHAVNWCYNNTPLLHGYQTSPKQHLAESKPTEKLQNTWYFLIFRQNNSG